MSSAPLTQREIADRLRNENLDEWIEPWWATQGTAKRGALELMPAILPFPIAEKLSVLDLCCGPGDVGRVIRSRFPKACVDCVDRDSFLLSLCAALNARVGVKGEIFTRDMWKSDWSAGLSNNYDAIATANALHWFNVARIAELFRDLFRLLRPDGVFVFLEPASAEARFAGEFGEWKWQQANRYDPETWERFWARVNALLGYDHTPLLKTEEPGLIGDDGIPVSEWVRLLESAGFRSCDVLLRSAEKLVVASAKP
jgi:SAM-dependent methyltransferase